MASDIGALYEAHAAPIWRYVRARLPTDHDAEDVTSDVFMRAIRSHDTFDPAKGTEAGWIVGIARHAVADWWRRRRPEDLVGEVSPAAGVGRDRTGGPGGGVDHVGAADPADHAVRADDARGVLGHLACLSDREHEAIALRFGAELSSAEIGASMGISPTAARMLVYRGLTKLREVMADE